MSGIEFGKELKAIRNKVKYPTKTLSTKVGKSTAYVSQLERGLIKNPDYDTCFKLLKELAFPTDKIEDFLYTFDIVSEKRKAFEIEANIQRLKSIEELQESGDEDFYKNNYPYLFDNEHDVLRLKNLNNNISNVFESLIEKDFTRAEKVINNISKLTKSRKSFNFLCSLFEYDFFNITDDEKNKLVKSVLDFNLKREELFDYEGEENE